jgi:hypothetical protein
MHLITVVTLVLVSLVELITQIVKQMDSEQLLYLAAEGECEGKKIHLRVLIRKNSEFYDYLILF